MSSSFERQIAFGNNDLPGIMTSSSILTYLNRFSVLAGKKITFCTNNDSSYSCALEMSKVGAEVKIFDARNKIDNNLSEKVLEKGMK